MIAHRTQIFNRLYALILHLANEDLPMSRKQPAAMALYGVDVSPCNGSIAPCRYLRQSDYGYCESRAAIEKTKRGNIERGNLPYGQDIP